MATPDCGASDRPSMSRPALMRSGGAVWAGGGACAQAGVATASVANKTKPRCIGPPSGARRISLCSSPCQDVRQGRRLSHLRRAGPQKRPSAGARAASFLRHANANQGGSMDAGRLPMGELVYGRERVLVAVMLLVSLLLYGSLVTLALSDASTGGVFLFYGVLLAFGGFVAHAFALGRIRGNGVLVTERQFPFLQQMVNAHARQLGLTYSPTVYVLESGGILNAFATKLLGRKFVIVNADVLALAVRQGEAVVSFIVGHELGHHWRGHLKWRWLTTPGRLVPYLGAAYSRACEFTCDRVGAYCEPISAIAGLLGLAARSWLHQHVNAHEFARQAEADRGFWIRRAELVSSHPRLPRRAAALFELGGARPATQPLA